MRYKNSKTGAVIDSSFKISGGDWFESGSEKAIERIAEAPNEPTEISEEPQAEQQEENTADFDGITVKQIKQELDAFGIKYSPTAKKQELYDLMMQQGE